MKFLSMILCLLQIVAAVVVSACIIAGRSDKKLEVNHREKTLDDTVKNYVCRDCFGKLVARGYMEKYFICLDCGLKNCIVHINSREYKNGPKRSAN